MSVQTELDLTVYIVDDDDEVRISLQQLFESVSLPVTAFESADDFLAAVTPDDSGCVITDVRMPGMTGLEFQREMAAQGYRMPVVVITAFADVAMAVNSMKLGAIDFVSKPYQPKDLVDTVQQILKNVSSSSQKAQDYDDLVKKFESLTRRERDVFDLIGKAQSTKQIALALGIGLTTVDYHRANILAKFETDNVITIAQAYERLRHET